MQKAFSLPRSCMQILRVGKKALKRAKVNMTKAANNDRSRNPRRIHELRLFLLFGLRRMWLSSFRAVTVGCRKRFLAPKLYKYTASGQKTLKRAKINYNKSRNLRPKTQVAALFALWSAPNVTAQLILRGLCAIYSRHTRLSPCRRQICRSRQCSSGT